MKYFYKNYLFYNQMLSIEEVLTGFTFLIFCAPFWFVWWKACQKVKIHLHSSIRYAVFVLVSAWIFAYYCGALFLLSEETGVTFLKNVGQFALIVGYVLGMYLGFSTLIVLIWGVVRALWNQFKKAPIR